MTVIKPHKTLCLCLLAILPISSCESPKTGDSQTHVVEIKQMSFVPNKLAVSPGDTVKWINRDLVTHNVSSEHWKSSELEQGENFAIKVTEDVTYNCRLHPVMKGKIITDNHN